MDFASINALLDDAVSYLTGWATQKQNYESQLAAKDSQIADLTNKLQVATNALQTDQTGFASFHDKLANLSTLIKGQPPDPTAAPATTGQTNGANPPASAPATVAS